MTDWADTPDKHRRVGFQCTAFTSELEGHCFFELHAICANEGHCDARMAAERQRIWELLRLRAALGDEMSLAMLEGVSGPDDLLGGPREG